MTSQPFAIAEPCTESWDAMTPRGDARFCASCQKHVVDLTTLTERQIHGLTVLTGGRFCGRQTIVGGERVVAPEPALPASPSFFRRFVVRAGLAAGALSAAACAPAHATPTPLLAPADPSGPGAPVPTPAPAPVPVPVPDPREVIMGDMAPPTPEIHTQIRFAPGSAKLDPKSLPALKDIAQSLNGFTWIPMVAVVGTAADDEGRAAQQQALGLARARAVQSKLVALGVDPKRLKVTFTPVAVPAHATAESRAATRHVGFQLCDGAEPCP